MFGLVDESGRVTSAGRHAMPPPAAGQDYWMAFPVVTTPGEYRLRFAVSDANGNVGSVEHRVAAHLARFGSLSASDLFTTWIGAQGEPRFLALDTLPAAATMVQAWIELYPDAGTEAGSAATVHFTVMRDGETNPVLDRDVAPTANQATLTAAIDIPGALFEPGEYTIRATISQAGAVVGAVSSTFRRDK